jgi:hypothetical protein
MRVAHALRETTEIAQRVRRDRLACRENSELARALVAAQLGTTRAGATMEAAMDFSNMFWMVITLVVLFALSLVVRSTQPPRPH